MINHSMVFVICTMIFFFAGFGTLAYISLFDPESGELLQITVAFISKICTPFG